jgi:hypothetical protein
METSEPTRSLDPGRLLRMQAMVTQAAHVDATCQAGGALARAYLSLREEMLRILEPDELAELREECERLFPVIEEPPDYSHVLPKSTAAKLSTASRDHQAGKGVAGLMQSDGV